MYETHFKLSAKPFRLSPDARFYFDSRGHARAYAYLRYGLSQGEGFIVITGEIGTGKTTLVEKLFNSLGNDNVIAARLVTTQLGPEETLKFVASEFGLETADKNKADLLIEIEKTLVDKAKNGIRALLVVDEAQNLQPSTLEELRMLSNFNYEGHPLIQSFLLGQPQFKQLLHQDSMEQLRQRVIASYHLEPLQVDETKDYIMHRLRLAGWTNDPEFTEEALQQIHEVTAGVPRLVNKVCDRLMLLAYLEDMHKITGEAVNQVAGELEDELATDSAVTSIKAVVKSEEPETEFSSLASDPAYAKRIEERLEELEIYARSFDEKLTRINSNLLKLLMQVWNKPNENH